MIIKLPVCCVVLSCLVIGKALGAQASAGYRWFQIEVSIFSNEYPEYRDAELWSVDRLQLAYPDRLRKLDSFGSFLQLEDFDASMFGVSRDDEPGLEPLTGRQRLSPDLEYIASVGPFPARQTGDISLPDIARDPYLQLPTSLSEFQTTNARLERSPVNRLLFHGLWRQPVMQASEATALLVQGGQVFGDHHELEGSITIRFNQGEDRVVIDANLWLSEFTRLPVEPTGWELPPVPATVQDDQSGMRALTEAQDQYSITRIVQMRQSREMRSTEFHYLDHPAIGLVISVMPYEVPAPMTFPLETPVTEPLPEPPATLPSGLSGTAPQTQSIPF